MSKRMIIFLSTLIVGGALLCTSVSVLVLMTLSDDRSVTLNSTHNSSGLHIKQLNTASRLDWDLNLHTRISRPWASPLPPAVLPENATLLTSESLPARKEYIPEVGNGHLATVVQSDAIFMNGLYNGANFSSHRARIPSTAGYSINSTTPAHVSRRYSLDLARGIFTESYTAPGVEISLRTYAHRQLTLVLVTELVMSRDDVTTNVSVEVDLNPGPASDDVEFDNDTMGVVHGRTREAEYPEISPQTSFYILKSATLAGTVVMTTGVKSETFLSLTVIDVNKELVLTEFDLAQKYFQDGELLERHVSKWTNVWQRGRIDVTGDMAIARLNYACLYYILSSLPFNGGREEWPFVGLSPGGLAHGSADMDYLGHVFWDQDTWMFPPIALLHPDIGRTIVSTRSRTLPTAKLAAQRTGYDGARYPWESAFTGFETCPAEQYGEMELHIIGDVSMMIRQYWQLTRDRETMADRSGAEIVWETAKFWASRATRNVSDGTFSILNIMPPDEFHYPVNDSVYTNTIAAINLRFANEMAKEFGKAENATWTEIADKLRLLYDPDLDYHPEYEGFTNSVYTKQADVVLLGYPLMADMDRSTRENDLVIYEKTTPIRSSPAMSWGMFLLGWLELGNETKAEELFNRTVINAQEPFLVWSEYADGDGATNFLTGMGGYLQMVMFGYGGCRIHDDRLTFNPILLPGTSRVKFTGLDYRGVSFALEYSEKSLTLTQTSIDKGRSGLEAKFVEDDKWEKLTTGQAISKNRQSFDLRTRE
ncbi:unnamed protein product [Lymnaea stagnalis]|uniref:Protein-glucosylgalactosylhydroxylysine glucosidase n=1 Tax=Lymnaea stagnalis TaxID=6523 RepID=A0AAV2HS43_LYMST